MEISNVKLVDIGCGENVKDGYFGIDISKYKDVSLVQDLRFTKLPFANNQLERVYASHFLEHLTFDENIFLFNEVYRCMQVGGTFEIVVPHGMSFAGMTDLSHKTFWVEDTFGYFSPDNKYYYSWFYTDPKSGERMPVINKWKVLKNDNTPPIQYTTQGWVTVKLREVHAFLEKLE